MMVHDGRMKRSLLILTEQKKSTTLRYTAFVPLSEGEQSLESRFAEIRGLIDNGSHERAIEKCVELIKVGLEGLRYLQT